MKEILDMIEKYYPTKFIDTNIEDWNNKQLAFEIESFIKDRFVEKEFALWLIDGFDSHVDEENEPDINYLHNWWLTYIKDK